MGKNERGDSFYVDMDRIRKVDGYVYYWQLTDLLKPNSDGEFSGKLYIHGDCKLFRLKVLSASFYTQSMGEGITSSTSNTPDEEWRYPIPKSPGEYVLNAVCNHTKKNWWQFW